jgi:C-terminal processing protease CtpA/Prc
MIGDLILEVNGKDIRKSAYNDVAFLLKTLQPGKVSLKIGRFKSTFSLSGSNSANQSTSNSKTTSRRNSITEVSGSNSENQQVQKPSSSETSPTSKLPIKK